MSKENAQLDEWPSDAGKSSFPEYVSVKEAARMLGLSDKRVYEYVDEKRFPNIRREGHIIQIPERAIKPYKKKPAGRPRRNEPIWRISEGDNIQFKTSIFVQILPNQRDRFVEKLEEIQQRGEYLFPGTIARSIWESMATPGQVEIFLIWRKAIMPEKSEREKALSLFRQAFDGILDWNKARYASNKVFIHT